MGDPSEMRLYKRQSRELYPMDIEAARREEKPIPWHLSLPHVLVALLVATLFGYHIGVVNIPLPYIARDLGFADDAFAQGFIVSICLIGAFVGCAFSATIADTLGRRRAFQLCAVPLLIGPVISAKATNLEFMLAGRFLVGLGLGVGAPVLSLYISEISPTQVRGLYGSFNQSATCIGILSALIVGLPIDATPTWWRACFWISTVPAAVLLLGMELCAESPRWLFKRSRGYEAEHELERLWGQAHAKTAMLDLTENSEEEVPSLWKDLLEKRYLKVVLLGGVLYALQQFSGINAIFYFSSTVLKDAGVSSDLAATVCVGVVNLAGSCIAAIFMERLGRRKLMIWSFTGMGMAMLLQSATSGIESFESAKATATLVGTLFYVFIFAVGAGPVPALLLPEILPMRIRGKGMAFAMCVHWVTHFMVGLLFLPCLNQVGPAALYLFFAVVSMVAAVFVRRNVIETKGRSLEDLEALLISQ